MGDWEVPVSAWNYHGPPTDTDLIQVSRLFLLEKGKTKLLICSILFLSRRLSPGIWMVRSQMFLLPNFEQRFLVSCRLGGKCWILG